MMGMIRTEGRMPRMCNLGNEQERDMAVSHDTRIGLRITPKASLETLASHSPRLR